MRSSLRVALALGVAITCASCGGDGGGSTTPNPSPSPTPNPPTDNSVIIRITGQSGAFSFTPNPASAGGQPVKFVNESNETHLIQLNDGSLSTATIAPGAT